MKGRRERISLKIFEKRGTGSWPCSGREKLQERAYWDRPGREMVRDLLFIGANWGSSAKQVERNGGVPAGGPGESRNRQQQH